MNEKPILFSAPMVRAILDGTKTQTRRVVKAQPLGHFDRNSKIVNITSHPLIKNSGPGWYWSDETAVHGAILGPIKCPYGKPGDHLWVRETLSGEMYASKYWTLEYAANSDEVLADIPDDWMPPINMITTHRERGDNIRDGGFDWWRCVVPSIHMPRWASRILLRVTDIRVERVQDITPADAKMEGDKERSGFPEFYRRGAQCHVDWFADLWDSINAKRGFGWNSNPWVWAVTFERVNP